MKILSLFDGISCGQLALRRAGIRIDKYYASEIDKYAIEVTMHNFPKTIQLGDVTKIDFTKFIGEIDLLIGGSPCQDLSIAKKDRKGLDGSRSGLFFKYVEALETIKPKYFLLENVASMKKEDRDTITSILGVEPIMINSALVSAQQRKRYYWTNINGIVQPDDKNIFLKDILQAGAMSYTDKAYTLTASYSGACFPHDFLRKQRQMVAEPLGCALRTWPGISNGENRIKRPEVRQDGKANALTLVNTDSMVCEPVRLGHFGNGGQGQRIYSIKAKSVCLGTGGANKENYKIDLPDGKYIIRKLTPVECERLQTLPDNYTACISATRRYRTIGNGWTVDVIAHIFSFLEEAVRKRGRWQSHKPIPAAGEVEYKPINIFEWAKRFRKRRNVKDGLHQSALHTGPCCA